MSDHQPKPGGGMLHSLKQAGDNLLALLQNRIELFAVELQEEKYRALQAVLWLSVGVILLFLGLALAVGTLALWTWHCWGFPGLCGLTGLLLVAGALVLGVMWKRLSSTATPFSGTLEELKKDREWLQRKP